ncbi:MAG: zinc ribbon domain-containing protein [Nitrospirae bacterium]|nr:zinc ribbon domain-containing protein [Nitrospirota bacterium]
MKCPKCLAVNSERRHFCKQCGSRLLDPCLQCGFANEAEDIYCGGCGRGLRETASATSIQSDTAPSHSPSSPGLPPAFLAKLLAEERVEAPSDLNEAKKAVTQEEIDKLFDK